MDSNRVNFTNTPIWFFLVYFLVGVIVCAFIDNNVMATVITNIAVGAYFLYCYHNTYRKNNTAIELSSAGRFKFGAVLFSLMVFMWFSTQIMATWFYNTYGDASYDAYTSNVADSNIYIYILLVLVIAPIFEEVFVRGLIFNWAKGFTHRYWAYIISAGIFALMHGTIVHIFIAFTCGIFFALVYEIFGKLRYAILAHSVYNLLSIILGGMVLPDWMFQPAVFVSMNIMVCVGLSSLCLYVNKNRD